MVKKAPILIPCIIFLLAVHSSWGQDPLPDFRKARWGMTSAEVKETEASKPAQEMSNGTKQLIIYKDSIGGLPCDIIYILAHDKLVRAEYSVTVEHSSKTEYLSDFHSLVTSLTEKYGNPSNENTYWQDDLKKDDQAQNDASDVKGRLNKYTTWITATSSIVLYLTGDSSEIALGIQCSSKELASLDEAADTAEE